MGKTSGKSICVIGAVIAVLLGMAPYAAATTNSAGPPSSPAVTRIPNSVVPVVATGQLPQALTSNAGNQPLTLTITLKRNDQSGFDSFLSEVQDPASSQYRHFLTQTELANRFGPSLSRYAAVQDWLTSQGLKLVDGSASRLTLTVEGTRTLVQRVFATPIESFTNFENVWFTPIPRVPKYLIRSRRPYSQLAGCRMWRRHRALQRTRDLCRAMRPCSKRPTTA